MTNIRRAVVLLSALVMACGGAAPAPVPAQQPLTQPAPLGTNLTAGDIGSWMKLFDAAPLTGGQVSPRSGKFIDVKTVIFAQFDHPTAAAATAIRYIGLQTKSVFCLETQPDKSGQPNSSFTHFHRYVGTSYGSSHGGPPGSEGYWGTWIAATDFTAAGAEPRDVKAGVDYKFSPTPAPACGANVPPAGFSPTGAEPTSKTAVASLASFFSDAPFRGAQQAPLIAKWVTDQIFVFVMFDTPNAAQATAVMHYGIAKRGTFCNSSRPSTDFSTFHRWQSNSWATGGLQGDNGYWMMVLDTSGANLGVNRSFEATPPPSC